MQKQERLRREREWQEEQRLKEVEKAKRDEEAERRSRALAAERYKQDMEAATTEKEKQVSAGVWKLERGIFEGLRNERRPRLRRRRSRWVRGVWELERGVLRRYARTAR